MPAAVPIIDVTPLVRSDGSVDAVARAIDAACRDTGFFTIVGHGIDPDLRRRLERCAREFFALDDAEKAEIAMAHGGPAWRGWFPLDGELTSGVPDHKEGLYFAAERVGDRRPLHGANQFPRRPAALRDSVLEYLDALTELGRRVMRGIALALALDAGWFAQHLTGEPTVLFRIFHYPPLADGPSAASWSVGEHTDYGLLTILGQDATGGLEVHGRDGWIAVPPMPDSFVCNIGDMLDRMTGGRYRSTPHRVRNTSATNRVSFPFFFDPAWDARVPAIPDLGAPAADDAAKRWDGVDVHGFDGTYGEYLLRKVSRVFPALRDDVLP